MHDNEAARRRAATVMHPFTGVVKEYLGDQIYSVTEKGLVISVSETKMFYPWNRVTSFSYHTQDTAACKVIQGF